MNNGKRVVITGMGVISPFGVGTDVLWDSITKGKSAIGKITAFDATDYKNKVAGEVKDFKPEDFMPKKEAKRYDRFLQFSKAATKMCMEDSGIEVTEELSPKFGVSIGSGIGGMRLWEITYETLVKKGPSRIGPFFIPMMLANMASGLTAIDYGLKGPNNCIVTACATGSHNISMGYEYIRDGKATVMLAGGTDGAITRLGVGGFASMKATTSADVDPQKASRPFDKLRDGFVMSEGAAILLLEELSHAKARGAKIYGEIVGVGMSGDGYHITKPHPEGEGAARSMKIALDSANLSPEKIDYINAHGTSTPLGDIAETKAIKSIFGDYAYKLPISSTKSMHGHLLGAAGAIEALISTMVTIKNVIPPTINQEVPDPECDLDYVPNEKREKEVNYAMSNSFGFGGTNSVLIFKKYDNE